MKLYISYYDNYVSIVEGIYNKKKEKYDIKNTMFLSGEDVELDTNDKYELLVEALRLNNFKSKNVVLSLNTRDVIIKTTQLAKVPPKDLDGIMNNDIYEMMSLDDMDYTFSYEVTNEKEVEGKETLDITMGAMALINMPVIIILGKYAIRALKDYENQRKAGKSPNFSKDSIDLPYCVDYWHD